jgi:hypothetical protein
MKQALCQIMRKVICLTSDAAKAGQAAGNLLTPEWGLVYRKYYQVPDRQVVSFF